MSNRDSSSQPNLSLYVIVFLCLLLFISVDFNVRYFLNSKVAMQAPAVSMKSSGAGSAGVPAKKPVLQQFPFKGLCKHYGFLQQAEYLPLVGALSQSQHMLGIDGEIQQVEANQWSIFPEPNLRLLLYSDARTKIVGNFMAGDCIRAVYAGDGSNRAILIAPQQ